MVEIDERGRLTVPKEIGLRGTKAIVISAATYFVVLPIQGDPYRYAKDWLRTDKSAKELKESAEEAASHDATTRAKRREQC